MQPVITLYNQGLTMGKAGTNHGHAGKRSSISGWTTSTTRRHVKWLYSVDSNSLDGYGYAFTLTVKICPSTPEKWSRLRDTFFKRLSRSGAIRIHWLTEWQRRGVPHLHGSVYFPKPLEFSGDEISSAFCDVASDYEPLKRCQYIRPIDEMCGWLKYLAKHSARGVHHYQRARENMPSGWLKSGRMWGVKGDWPIGEAKKFSLSEDAFFKYRRLVRSWRISNARDDSNSKRVSQAKKMLRSTDSGLSRLRGVSEWIDKATAEQFINFLARNSDHPNYIRLLTVGEFEPPNEGEAAKRFSTGASKYSPDKLDKGIFSIFRQF